MEFQLIETAFTAGLNEKVSPYQVKSPHLLQLQNLVFNKLGEIQVRAGSTLINDTLSSGTGIFSFDNSIVTTGGFNSSGAIDFTAQIAYDTGTKTSSGIGQHQAVNLSQNSIVANNRQHQAQDCATINGVTVYAYEELINDVPHVIGVITSEATGAILFQRDLGTGLDGYVQDPRVVALGTHIYVFYYFVNTSDVSDSALYYSSVTTSSPTSFSTYQSKISLPDTYYPDPSYECRAVPTATTPYIAIFWQDSSTGDLLAEGWLPSGTIISAHILQSNQDECQLYLTYYVAGYLLFMINNLTTNTVYYEWQPINGPFTQINFTSLDTSETAFNKMTSSVNAAGGNAVVFYEEQINTPVPPNGQVNNTFVSWALKTAQITINSTVAVGPSYFDSQSVLVGDAYLQNNVNIPVLYDQYQTTAAIPSSLQKTYFILSNQNSGNFTPLIVAKIANTYAGGAPVHPRCCTVAQRASDGAWIFPILIQTQFTGVYNGQETLVNGVSREVISYGVQQAGATVGENLHITGGFLAAWDGGTYQNSGALSAGVVEQNFHLEPEPPVVIGSPVGVTRIQVGTTGEGSPSPTVGSNEITTVVFPPPLLATSGPYLGTVGSGWQIQPGSYFCFFSQITSNGNVSGGTPTSGNNGYYVFFQVNGSGNDPALGGTYQSGLLVELAPSDTDLDICRKVSGVISTKCVDTAGNPLITTQILGVGSSGSSSGNPIPGACQLQLTALINPANSTPNTSSGIPSGWCDHMPFFYSSSSNSGSAVPPQLMRDFPPGGPPYTEEVFNFPTGVSPQPGSIVVYYLGLLANTPTPAEISAGQGGGWAAYAVAQDNGQGGFTSVANPSSLQVNAGPWTNYITTQSNTEYTAGGQCTLGLTATPSGTNYWYISYSLATTSVASTFIVPPGNRFMPNGMMVVPYQTPVDGATAALVLFEVDGQGGDIAVNDPTLFKAYPLGSIHNYNTPVSLLSSDSAATVATKIYNFVTAIISGAANVTASLPFNNVLTLSWSTGTSVYVPAYNYNATGNLQDVNFYVDSPLQPASTQVQVSSTSTTTSTTGNKTSSTTIVKQSQVTSTNQSGTAGLPTTWFYQVCYEWNDAQGNVHRSAPSIPVPCLINAVCNFIQLPAFNANDSTPLSSTTTVVVGGCMPRIITNGCQFTGKQNVSVVIYRTLSSAIQPAVEYYRVSGPNLSATYPGQNFPAAAITSNPVKEPIFAGNFAEWQFATAYSSGTIVYAYVDNQLYLFEATENATSGGVYPFTTNSLTGFTLDNGVQWEYAGSLTQPITTGFGYYDYPDGVPDQVLGSSPLIYTLSSLPNQAAPPSNFIFSHRDRLWAIDAENPNVVYYSQTYEPGTQVAIAFNDTLTLPLDEPILSLAEMDDRIIFFCQTKKYALQGDGPDALGNNSNFSTLEQIHSDAPLLAPFSISLIPTGLIFQSTKGLYNLTRQLTEIPITDATNEIQGNTVISAVYMEDRFELRLGLNTGEIVVYQTLFNSFSTFTNWLPLGVLTNLGYTFLDPATGNLAYEDSTQVNSEWNDEPIDWQFQLPWYSFASLNGYQETQIAYFLLNNQGLGGDSTVQSVKVQALYDYNPNVMNTTVLQAYNTYNYPLTYAYLIPQPMCQAISLIVSPESPSRLQTCLPVFEAVTFEVGTEPYGARIPATRISG
jgi:hypothetical protein